MSHGGPKPGLCFTANMSKRGLFTRLSAPNQTLILVKARLPKRNSGAGNGANPASYGVGLSSRGRFRGLARPLPVQRPRRAANPSSFRANGARERASHSSLRAERSNPSSCVKGGIDCFVARAPRNDVVKFEFNFTLTCRRPARRLR